MKKTAVAALVGLVAFAATARAEPVTIRQGWANMTTIMSPIVFEKKDLMKHYGVSYVLEPVHFASSSAEVTAIATGDLDIMIGGPIAFAHAVENAKLDDMRIIADGFQDGIGDYFSSRYEVRNDSGIKTLEDLKGKVLVSNGIGGTHDVVIRAAMAKAHLVDKKDFTLIETELGAMNSMLLEHRADLITSSPPFSYDPKLEAGAHPLFRMKDIIGPSQMGFLSARAGFLEKNRAALYDFFEDEERGIRWFLDPANRAEAMALVAKATKQPASRFEDYLWTTKDYYHDPKLLPNRAALQHDFATLRSLGFMKGDLDLNKYVDLSYVEEGAKRLP